MLKRWIIVLFLGIGIFTLSSQESVQIAILLDTSNSMDGLITQAKTQIWKVVNEISTAKKNGKSPDVEIALYQYGNDRLSSKGNFIEQVLPFTKDLDMVSDKLFGLTTCGGYEYCGAVIEDSVKKLEWSKNNKMLKVIYIAGNEEFTQGAVDYKKSCKTAIKKGIIINTIYCGDLQDGRDTGWKDGADLADGSYLCIDQNTTTKYVETPYDSDVIALNNRLNDTYIYYSEEGMVSMDCMVEQDENAALASTESEIQRVFTKKNKNYSNMSWDLVDSVKNDDVDIKSIDKNDLPRELQKLSDVELEKYIDEQNSERDSIKKELEDLEVKRKEYINEQLKSESENSDLGSAIVQSLKKAAEAKGYSFE